MKIIIKITLLLIGLILSPSMIFAQSSGLPARVSGTIGNCLNIATGNITADAGAPCGSGGSTNGSQIWPALNGGTGTGANLLAGWNNGSNDSNFAQTLPHPTSGQLGTNANPPILGVCVSSCGTTGLGNFQYEGSVQWICDNVVGVGDWVGPSPTTNGQCHDPVINTGVNSQQLNENPESNSAIGIALVANPSIGTAATILLMPHMGYVQTGAVGPGQGFAMTSLGSPFTSMSTWAQRPSTASGSSGHARALFGYHSIELGSPTGAFGAFFFIDNGEGGKGVSGRDMGIDSLSFGFGGPPNESIYFNGSTYTIPTPLTCTGTVALTVTNTTGVYSCTLTGNTTFTISSDNTGHEITFDLKQAAGSAFIVAWPGNFINPPTMTATLGASTVAKFYYDGTNYTCTGGCPSSGGGSGTVTSIATTSPITGGTITNTGTIGCATCTITIASGTSALGTSAITSGACATVVTTSATGTATTDVVPWGFNADPTAITGYSPSVNGMLTIIAYPTANNVNFKVCNNTSASVTPGAVTLNWRIVR